MLRQPASTSGDVDRIANRKHRHIVPRRSTEKKNPHNIQFVSTNLEREIWCSVHFFWRIYLSFFFCFVILQERQVAALEYRQEEQRKRYADVL